uniref:tetratricopeptide repeat protein n=1 Tax=Flavobacterium sp. TaxID=239 RepID=UPI00286EB362
MKKTYTVLLLLIAIGATAQSECKAKLDTIKKMMDKERLYKDYDKMFKDLLPCAESGIPLAQNYIGLFYLEGLGVEKDEVKGFQFLEQGAINNSPIAQNNLGSLYREGKGCTLDMDKAVYWYQKAADAKNSRAAYSLGYMYLKGFGVPQDYATAVSWFEKSKFDMAKHWLGVCHYLGYGVPQDTQKALEYFYSNGTPNSKAFLKNLKIDKRELVLDQAEQAIEEASEAKIKIDPEVIASSRETIEAEAVENSELKTTDIIGEWTGRFIEYDWSGKIPLRVLPIEITFTKNDLGDLQTKIIFQGKTFEDLVLFDNNNLFLQGFKFNLAQLYNHSFQDFKLDYTVLGMDLSQKTYNNI